MPYTFTDFRDGPGGEVCRRFDLDIAECVSWQHMKNLAGWFDDTPAGKEKSLADRATEFYDVASSGERALLLGALYAADFASLADDLAQGKAWRNMHRAGGNFREALAACILQID